MPSSIAPKEAIELRLLWSQFQTATARVLEIIRTEGTDAKAVLKIFAADTEAGKLIQRIKEIRREK